MKMKKLLALLLALSLCMVCFTAFAEEAAEDEEEITAITNTVSYEGVEVSLADMGLVFLLPSDWVEVAAPENAQFAYASPDGAITMCGFLCSDFDTVAAGIDEQLQSGDIQPEVSEVTIHSHRHRRQPDLLRLPVHDRREHVLLLLHRAGSRTGSACLHHGNAGQRDRGRCGISWSTARNNHADKNPLKFETSGDFIITCRVQDCGWSRCARAGGCWSQ